MASDIARIKLIFLLIGIAGIIAVGGCIDGNNTSQLRFDANGPTYNAAIWVIHQPFYQEVEPDTINLVYSGHVMFTDPANSTFNNTPVHLVYCNFNVTVTSIDNGIKTIRFIPHEILIFLSPTGKYLILNDTRVPPDRESMFGEVFEQKVLAAILDNKHDLTNETWDSKWLAEVPA